MLVAESDLSQISPEEWEALLNGEKYDCQVSPPPPSLSLTSFQSFDSLAPFPFSSLKSLLLEAVSQGM